MKNILITAIILLSSCGTHTQIKIKTAQDSYCEDTYYVSVETWVRDWKDFPIALEYWDIKHGIPKNKVDSVTKILMIGAVKCQKKIDKCLKEK